MIALVTGSSSGIGRDMARYLNFLGYDLIITANFHLSTLFFKKIIIFAIYF